MTIAASAATSLLLRSVEILGVNRRALGFGETRVCSFLWPPHGIGQVIIFLPCGFFYLLSSFFPRPISAVAEWMSTIHLHMVWPWP